MKLLPRLLLVVFSFLLFINFTVGQTVMDSVVTKGYLLIAGNEEIVFFPDSMACSRIFLRKVEKLRGMKLIATTTSTYDFFRIDKITKPYHVRVNFERTDGSSYVADYSFKLVAITGVLVYSPGRVGQLTGFPFEKNGQRYLFNYSDNFDYLLYNIVPLSKKGKRLFLKQK